MEIEYPWHEKTQEEVAKQGIHNQELKDAYEELLLMEKNKREAVLDNLYQEAKELDPNTHANAIRDVVALLVGLDKSGVKGQKHNLHAGTLLNKLKNHRG